MIDKHIDKSISKTPHDRTEEFDTKSEPPSQIFKEDAIVKKIWSYTYQDENGNKIELPVQDTTGGEKEDERQISCCGVDITDFDIKMCPKCSEHY